MTRREVDPPDESSSSGFDDQIQSFEGVRSQKLQGAEFAKDHFVNGKILVEADNRETHATSDFLTVCEDEA